VTPRGALLWVWEDGRPQAWPQGYDGALVKAFDGKSTTGPGGFGWAANYRAWRDSTPGRDIGAWGVAYPQDGTALAEDLAPALGRPAYIVLDAEDFNGQQWSDQQIRDVILGFRQHFPGVPLGYSSYPTRAQCSAHGIDQALLDQLADFAMPQVYFDYQAAELATVWADHRAPVVTVSPADYHAWDTLAGDALRRTGAVAYWRAGVSGWTDWPHETPQPAPTPAPPPPAADPLRPQHWEAFPAERFIAWDGHRWWVTDCVWRRGATEADAAGLHNLGLQVRWWPSCASETVLAVQ
jgi:hypothetical protein